MKGALKHWTEIAWGRANSGLAGSTRVDTMLRKAQSVTWAWIPLALALVFTVTLALLVGLYGRAPLALVGGTAIVMGCIIAEPCGGLLAAGVIVTGTGLAGWGGGVLLTTPGDTVDLQIADAADARATGNLPHLIMEATSSNGKPVGDRVKECVYRHYTPGGSCRYTEFDRDVETVVGDRAFVAAVEFEGETVLNASYGNLSVERTASYSLLLPVKGGERAQLILHVEGAPAGVWWRE